MNDHQHCGDHSGNCEKISRANDDIKEIKQTIKSLTVWLIGGMASLLFQAGMYIFTQILGKK